jgi:hypothetical protein
VVTNVGNGTAYKFDISVVGSEVPVIFDDDNGNSTYTSSAYQLKRVRSANPVAWLPVSETIGDVARDELRAKHQVRRGWEDLPTRRSLR